MSRTKPADQRRDDLLDAAEAAFVELGIAGTRVGEITARAGVAKGTFYLYFRSRADIVAAVQRRYSDRYVRHMSAAAAAAGDDWGAKLDALVVAGLTDHREGRRLHDVLFVDSPPVLDSPTPDGHGDDDVERLLAVVRDVLDGGVAAGAYRIADTSTTAMLLFNTLHGVYNPIWLGATPPDDDVLIAAAQAIFRRAAGLEEAAPAGAAAGARPNGEAAAEPEARRRRARRASSAAP